MYPENRCIDRIEELAKKPAETVRKSHAGKAAVNIATQCHRKKRPSAIVEMVRHDRTLCRQLIESENNQRMLDKISQLRGLSREAFLLKYIEEKTYEEIAVDMDKTPHQVRALCYKALGHIRYLLEEDERDLTVHKT